MSVLDDGGMGSLSASASANGQGILSNSELSPSPSSGGGGGAMFDISLLRTYLEALLPVVMGADPTELEASMFRLRSSGWKEIAMNFAMDSGTMVVYVDKIRREREGDEEAAQGLFVYQLVTQASYTPRHVSSIALIKRVPTLDASTPLASQLHLLSLFGPASSASLGLPADDGLGAPGAGPRAGRDGEEQITGLMVRESPYEALHSVVHNVMAPWFDAYVSSKSSKDKVAAGAPKSKDADTKMGIPMTKRKFAELELSLLHLQQNVEIPEIHLNVHPIVRAAVERCHTNGQRVTVDALEPSTVLQDSSFLNKLQSDVNSWVKEVQTVTKLDRDVASGTASQEINFWLSMEKAQENIEQQLRSDPILLTLDILKHAKRFHATVSFLADTGLKDCTEKVHNYNLLMKDLPLNELLSATDLEKVQDSLGAIFGHLNKKLRISPYPIKRALPLVEAISRDLNETLLKVLGSQRLMYQEFPRFSDTIGAAAEVFQVWDDLMKDFVNIAREVTRKRSEKFLPIKINPAHAKLRERLNYIGAFRKQHEQLRVMTSPAKGMAFGGGASSGVEKQVAAQNLAGIEMEEEIRAAYETVKVIDVLEVSQEGTEIWGQAETAYNERVARVENQIIARLRDRLGEARNAKEILRVLSQFNSLFVRPKVRGAIQEYQTQLLNSVKADIQGLHDKFKSQYRPSEANHMSQLRDLPEIAGAIIWARQIERQLAVYMKRVEDVLGKGWELYAEGQKLKSESDTFRKKLEPRALFDGWLQEINRRDMSISGRLFEITRNRAAGNTYQLAVNFDPQIIALFKEVRNLIWLNFQIPHSITNLAKDAKRVYPHAVSLMETVRTYTQTMSLVESNPGIQMLVAQVQSDVQQMITQGMSLRWEHFANTYESHRGFAYLPQSSSSGSGAVGANAADPRENRQAGFVRSFASVVSMFQDKTSDLIETHRKVMATIDELSSCEYSADAFSERLRSVQQTVDRLSLEGYPNLEEYVAALDARIEEALIQRLRDVSRAWCDEFGRDDSANGREAGGPGSKRKADKKRNTTKERDRVELSPSTHELRLRNNTLYLEPPLEFARARFFGQLHAVLAIVCAQNRISATRYEILNTRSSMNAHEQTYSSLLTRFNDATLERPFTLIEGKLVEVGQYVAKWLQFQALYDLESEHVFARLGDSLSNWQQLLHEIRKTRATFDNSDTQRSFGICTIDYEAVQGKINAKYDTWQREILNRFGSKLGQEMREVHAAILKARNELEQHSIEGSSTAQAVTFITFVQDLKKKTKKWTPQIEIFGSGQKTLERQRYMFPQDWLYVDQVEGEWSAFNEILSRKNASIQEQLAGLQMKIIAEDKIVSDKIAAIVTEWEQQKPIQGTLKADAAMNTINVYEARVTKLAEDRDLVVRAKESLDLEHSVDDRLEPIFEELRDLKAVWTALSGTWNQIGELRESNWNNVQPRKLRQQLDALLNQTKEMPSRMRQYAAFEYVQETLRTLLKNNLLITDLKSEAMRERHWRSLFKQLKVQNHYTPSSMTLGTVWDLDLKRHETIIKAVIVQAQGELALEEYLKQVRENWTNYTLDLVNYQNKCRLIRGWDNLFQLAGDNLNALRAMSMSPHYKVFEEEASLWEDRLSKVTVLFDTWIDVQRQWVYLEGIFTSSAEIRHILPVESSRFQNINTEFLTVMKKVYKSPFVLDVLNIPGVQKSLERLADLLGKIQKALGEYLERERALFPRFYFVGDEDLLEIIGNSKDIVRIMKHLKKMFAGIATIMLDEELERIEGMVSREGEEVPFKTPIVLKDYPKINDWLTKLESEMRISLAQLLSEAAADLQSFYTNPDLPVEQFLAWIDRYPAQLVVLTVQVLWTSLVDGALEAGQSLDKPLEIVLRGLDLLADTVLTDVDLLKRRKCEHLITELVHQRDVIRLLIADRVRSSKDFGWLYQMRFYLNQSIENPLDRLSVQMANASFPYGYEYLGVPDRLVQTPLTDRCYLTLTQALHFKLGGAPFGPAGTGKTESVKALGVQLGMFVLVFCCDETFDFQAMGRIFIGLCRVGAWGCFDEFNRLEERILSAVSQQVQSIQHGLAATMHNPNAEIELVGKNIKINGRTGIFITTNPTYAGRSNLPDNLKKLFRNMAMTHPDRELIAQVMLFSQGFRTAETLASKIVPFFNLCAEQLSPQPHYDFGLRALKAVLVSAGQLKRERLQSERDNEDAVAVSNDISEQEILIQSVTETIVPKLVADDVPLLTSLLADVFPGIEYRPVDLDKLKEHVAAVCAERHLVNAGLWTEKVLQLYQIQKISHGLMLVGPSGTGKTQAWQVLLAALERLEGVEGVSYVIDPKAVSKEALYGTLDQTTREWNDGLFTHVLRKIIDNVRGESSKRHWIIFDGDVDPEWVENLNSVLDDNRLLTLPNGERLNLPPNVRIMFEVEHLKYATLATVSRCGMIWFSDDIIDPGMLYSNYLETLKAVPLGADDDDVPGLAARRQESPDGEVPADLQTQRTIAKALAPFFEEDGLISNALEFAASVNHIMDFTVSRALNTLFSLINKTARNVIEYNNQHSDFPLSLEQIEAYATKRLIVSVVWAFTGDAKLDIRAEMGEYLRGQTGVDLPPLGPGGSLIDFDVQVNNSEWFSWQTRVPTIEIETNAVTSADVVIPTMDTVRHEEVLYSWLSEHKPLMLCGPPGSGKTMTLFSALRKLPDMEVVGLNFSSATTPELILKTFEQYCEYRKTPNGVVLAPVQIGRWIVVFCDEINLPATDKYGTQRVISFLRQLVESGGYWRTSDKAWVRLERIQFVGACNPPTDPGRVPLSHRFLRHAPLVMVDYPGEVSLNQIYGTFNRALLKVTPNLRGYADPLTSAMVDFYLASQRRFTPDVQAHYVYSPRELTRWMRGIYEAIKPLDTLSLEGLVRIWAHEALRLFQDRLVSESEKQWTDENIDATAQKHFPTVNHQEALARPILFSNWTSKYYIPVERESLREYTKARLKVFYEEELDVPLVLFNDVLDHVLRIDRVFRQTQGHLLLIGVSGSGKTTLSRFVAWMNGLSIFQIKVHNKYKGEDFDEDLRTVLRRAGCKAEKICFIMDESNVLDSGFLERMNTLLANAEVPGLFEGDEYSALMTACKEGAQRDGLMLDSHEELYRWFTQQVAKNLHVVFTMNPPENGLASRAATSPALFNRCVLDWFGDWSDQAFFQVGSEFTSTLDLDVPSYNPPGEFPIAYRQLNVPPTHRNAIVNALVHVHQTLYDINKRLSRRQGRYNYVTPRHYLDFINHYVNLSNEKREELEEQQRHLNVGLDKLRDTVVQVEELRKSLAVKRTQLEAKNAEANEKLKRMVADQQEAEQKKAASIEIQAALEKQEKDISERREVVMGDLADAEPAVRDAQASVSNIKKQHLTEVRSMGNPPLPVKNAMESVCILLGHKIDSWKAVQGIIRRDDFIASIVNFDTDRMMTRPVREKMKREYINKPDYNFETINRASKACGPLAKWVIAQVRFSEILDRVGPLRDEVQSLEQQAEETKEQAGTIITMIAELESSIATYKDEYAALISETQAIKTEMERVQTRVDRSIQLLDSLSSEKARWEAGSRTFDTQMSTIVGDALLSAAFLAYSGFFDQQYREAMWHGWATHLSEANIKFKPELSIADYLSTADDRLDWQSKSLPADTLCTENAIMLKRFDRYPLIIDPSGQATTFLTNEYKKNKLTVTSFLDEAFLKNLESALRFGNPLLIQDVEHLDPILNAVLNKELRRTGGRVLIRLGNQDIDFSPSFTMFLSTRDPSVEFSPDICSRVTFVNFTMTRSSLQSQSLDQVLKVERPDTDKKRTDLMKLQGEFRLRLRHLEKSLLQALNESKGNILEDDKVIDTLETLKKEAAEVTSKVEETDAIMQEVEHVTTEYIPLAKACSSVFFVLDQLNLISHFYQFSLGFFLEIFDFILYHNPNLQGVSDPHQRLNVLLKDLFLVVFKRTSRALAHHDHIMLAVLLAQIKARDSNEADALDSEEFEFFLEGGDAVSAAPAASIGGAVDALLNNEQKHRLLLYKKLALFKSVEQHIDENAQQWKVFLESNNPETVVPVFWEEMSGLAHLVRRMLVIKCLRPDRLLQAMSAFVNSIFGNDVLAETAYDLQNIVSNEVSAATPVALCSVPGYDASYRVDNLVKVMGTKCTSVAMGSQEGFALADQAIATGARTGQWVLLKNVHLAPSWLSQLEKKILGLNANRNFRLFLTCETNPVIPVNFLRASRILMNEPPPGLKANMLDNLRGLSPSRLQRAPAEASRLFFLLAFFHATLTERLRYTPLGWSKPFEFNDSDAEAAVETIESWLVNAAKGRANIDPASIPWDAVRSLLKQSVYGGKIDNSPDQRLLDSFVDSVFTPKAYDQGFALVADDENPLLAPEGTKMDQFMSWVQTLPDQQPPQWLALPPTAERVIAMAQGAALLSKLVRMRQLADDDETVTSGAQIGSSATASTQPAWMKALKHNATEWLGMLPTGLSKLAGDSDSLANPLHRFWARELRTGQALLRTVRADLQEVISVCDGDARQTNHNRALLNDLPKGTIPASWQRYAVPKSMQLGVWVADLAQRLAQLESMTKEDRFESFSVTLGLLFAPGAYLTATRQAVAHRTRVSLENLKLELAINSGSVEGGFLLQGLRLEGASWAEGRVSLNDGATIVLEPSSLIWVDKESAPSTSNAGWSTVPVTLYLNADRSLPLFQIALPAAAGISASTVSQRAVALRAV